MKAFGMKKIISIICSLLGCTLSLYGLVIGLQSIGTLGVIFIFPSIVALIIIVLDFLITIDEIKRGFLYSWISSLMKISVIAYLIPNIIHNYKDEVQYGVSNLDLDLILLGALAIVTVPSVLNIIKLNTFRKNSK